MQKKLVSIQNLSPKLLSIGIWGAVFFSGCHSSDSISIEDDWNHSSTPLPPTEPQAPISVTDPIPPPPSPAPTLEPTVQPIPVQSLYSGPASVAPFV